jgi:hypothetical protein
MTALSCSIAPFVGCAVPKATKTSRNDSSCTFFSRGMQIAGFNVSYA